MKRVYVVCLFLLLTTTFLLSQSNPVPLINPSARVAPPGVVSSIGVSQTDPKAQARVLDSYGKLPLSFEANLGQADGQVKFLSRTGGSPVGNDITVQGNAGSAGPLLAAPNPTSVTPIGGPLAGGTAVTITGTGFQTGATVTFGGAAATSVVVVNATTITAKTPAHAAGAVDVVVTNPDGQFGTLTNGYLYANAPTVTSVTPSSGPTAGGTAVIIGGTGFQTGAKVTFGGTAATSVVVVSATQITATTPAHAAGAVNIVVTNPDTQFGTLPNGYTYAIAPTISKVFGVPTIPLNGSTSLTFSLSNPNATNALTGVGFTDPLPAGLVVSTPNGLTGSCGGGTITATAGSGSISLSGATLAPSASCSFSVKVTGTTAGVKNNTTSAVTSNEGGNGNTASASITVVAPTTTAVTSTPNPSVFNQSVTFTATVTPTPDGGTVTFTYGTTTLCSNVALTGGVAVCAYATLPLGSDVVTAAYSGDANYGGSGGSVTQTVTAQTYTESVLYSFKGGTDGATPYAGLVYAGGSLYGTTYYGGAHNVGTVFKVASSGGTETVLYSFTGTGGDGANPRAGLVRDAQGNLYGTTINGGAYGAGTVFKVDKNGKEIWLYSFPGAAGESPYAGLVLDGLGNLYGTTLYGYGPGDLGSYGMAFKVDPAGQETVLYYFKGPKATPPDGEYPIGGLVRDGKGNLYGTTGAGGAYNVGTVFKVDPTGTETVLYSFNDTHATDGEAPEAGLVRDGKGNLYGTTALGGGSGGNYGTVFKVDKTGKETVLYSFSSPYVGYPLAGLVRDALSGNLYGTTSGCVQNCPGQEYGHGTVFEVDAFGTETVLYTFTGTPDGTYPIAGLVRDAKGNLYGTTSYGGAHGYGTVFKLTP